MPFTPGEFDIVTQVEASALDVVADVILKQLERNGKTRFTQQVGTGPLAFSIDVELVDIRIPDIRSLNPAERFRRGNTLASFEVEAELRFALLGINVQDTIGVRLKDLQIAIFTTPGGLPVGVALGFQQIDLDVSGLGFVGALLNIALDLVALGIRTALSPLGLVPIPILQFADAFTQLGLVFDRSTTSSVADGSPFVGVTQAGTGLYLAADFQAANNQPGAIATAQDILTPALNAGLAVSQRLINQMLATVLIADRFGLVRSIQSGGIRFGVTAVAVRFDVPGSRRASIGLDAAAAARVKSRKGGFFGRLFGGSRKVTIRASASIDLDAEITTDPQTQFAIVAFDFRVTGQGSVSVNSVLASVLIILLGPFFLLFLTGLSQLLNFAFDVFLPQRFVFDVQGSDLTIRLDRVTTQLGLGASIGLGGLSGATLKARIDAAGGGTFELEHFTVHQFAASGVPIRVDYVPESLETRPVELFLGVGLRSV